MLCVTARNHMFDLVLAITIIFSIVNITWRVLGITVENHMFDLILAMSIIFLSLALLIDTIYVTLYCHGNVSRQ